jgi:predicted RNA binding protein YcfA (HicA-like mRNA interferase family)
MPKLPIVSGAEAVKALQRLGHFVDRQRGSHVVLKKVTVEGERGCVIPMHREVALDTLRSAPKNGRGLARGIQGRSCNFDNDHPLRAVALTLNSETMPGTVPIPLVSLQKAGRS